MYIIAQLSEQGNTCGRKFRFLGLVRQSFLHTAEENLKTGNRRKQIFFTFRNLYKMIIYKNDNIG